MNWFVRRAWLGLTLGWVLWGFADLSQAQVLDAQQLVQQATDVELAADRDDHSHWRYRQQESGGNESVVVETEHGAIARRVLVFGKPVTASQAEADNAHIQAFVNDPSLQAKQKRDGAHDDKSATELLQLLPRAFTWKVAGETADTITLAFTPDPKFDPPNMEARVMGQMAGALIVDKAQHHIRTMKGRLTQDINIGFGLLARLRQGGTFDIERREVAPGMWQITETHVHIDGRALFFKTIGEQQDEVKTNFTQVPPGMTLEQAVVLLGRGGS